MRFSLPVLALAALPFGPADSAPACGSSPLGAEIVTFRLNAGDKAQFLRGPKCPDIHWQGLADAQVAAKTVDNDPSTRIIRPLQLKYWGRDDRMQSVAVLASHFGDDVGKTLSDYLHQLGE